VLVAADALAVDPAVAQRLLQRLVVRQAGRVGGALLRQDQPDAVRGLVFGGEPVVPGGGVGEDVLFHRRTHEAAAV
jgi:hypothetical protein